MMRKYAIMLFITMLLCVSTLGCTRQADRPIPGDNPEEGIPGASDSGDTTDEYEEDTVDAANRTMIANALGIEEDNRSIRFILNCLHTIGAGRIQSAEAGEDNTDHYLDLVAEDGTNYRVYLSGNKSVNAVKNMDTGEWPFMAIK